MSVGTAGPETGVPAMPGWPARGGALVITTGSTTGDVHPLGPGAHVIGRAADCEIVLPEAEVSRWHVLLRVPAPSVGRPGVVMIEDLGSRSGTLVNNMVIEGPTPLGDGDTVTVGRSVLIWNPRPGQAVAPSAAHAVTVVHPVTMILPVPPPEPLTEPLPEPLPEPQTVAAPGPTAPSQQTWTLPPSKAPVRPSTRSVTLSSLTSLAGLLTLVGLGLVSHLPLLIPPLAASVALIAAGSALPLAQPRNVMGGQIVSALVGFAVLGVLGPGPVAAGVAGGLALTAMLLLRVSHSPAAATAVIVGATAPAAPRFLTLLIIAVAILLAFGIVGARVERKPYPIYWW